MNHFIESCTLYCTCISVSIALYTWVCVKWTRFLTGKVVISLVFLHEQVSLTAFKWLTCIIAFFAYSGIDLYISVN